MKPYHRLPNAADDELNPYEYRLYGHYVRVCAADADGACDEDTAETAERCKMSGAKVSEVRRDLEQMGWITIEERPRPSKRPGLTVRIVARGGAG